MEGVRQLVRLGVVQSPSPPQLQSHLTRNIDTHVYQAPIGQRDGRAAQALRTDPHACAVKQVAPGQRQRAVRVLGLFLQRVHLGQLNGAGQLAVHQHAAVDLGQVLLGQKEIGREVDRDLGLLDIGRLAARLGHGLAQHLGKQIKTHARQVAVLLGAHQRTGAANLQVAHGNLHAAAQVLVLVDRHQAVGGLGRQRRLAREHKVRVCLHAPAAHTAL